MNNEIATRSVTVMHAVSAGFTVFLDGTKSARGGWGFIVSSLLLYPLGDGKEGKKKEEGGGCTRLPAQQTFQDLKCAVGKCY